MSGRDNIGSIVTDSEHDFLNSSNARILNVVANFHLFIHVDCDLMIGAINIVVVNEPTCSYCGRNKN